MLCCMQVVQWNIPLVTDWFFCGGIVKIVRAALGQFSRPRFLFHHECMANLPPISATAEAQGTEQKPRLTQILPRFFQDLPRFFQDLPRSYKIFQDLTRLTNSLVPGTPELYHFSSFLNDLASRFYKISVKSLHVQQTAKCWVNSCSRVNKVSPSSLPRKRLRSRTWETRMVPPKERVTAGLSIWTEW